MFQVRHYSITTKLTRMNMLVSGPLYCWPAPRFCTYDLVQLSRRDGPQPVDSGPGRRVQFGLCTAVQRPAFRREHFVGIEGRPQLSFRRVSTRSTVEPFATICGTAAARISTLPIRFPRSQTEPTGSRIVQLVLVHMIMFPGQADRKWFTSAPTCRRDERQVQALRGNCGARLCWFRSLPAASGRIDISARRR